MVPNFIVDVSRCLMKIFATCFVLAMLSSIPALGQASDSTGQPAASAPGGSAPVDLSGFREEIQNKNKALNDKVNAEKMLVKKNAAIIEGAKKIDADNRRLDAERKQLDAQNAEFERQRRAMMSMLGDAAAPAPAPAPTYVAQPVRTPTRVEPQPVQAEAQPVRNEAQPTQMELANATVNPASAAVNQPERSSPVAEPIVRTPPAQANQTTQPSQPSMVASVPVPASATVFASAGPVHLPENVTMAMLLSPIRPVYPQIAQNARIQGEVVLDAVISKTGLIESVQAVSGPELLRGAAMDAVRHAHYQPYTVGGENVQVTTTVTVVFRMS
jgi:protein TonB